MTLTEIRATLAELGLRPSRALGQNFLHDRNLAAWIVRQADLGPGDHLVEIGPGLGALTALALPRCRAATLIEKDFRLAARLAERLGDGGRVRVVPADAAAFDPRPLFPEMPVKLLGNLPYSAAGEILFRFTAAPSPVARLVVTVQREVADRLVAAPGGKNYGVPTLLIGRRWRVTPLRVLPPTVFFPVPQVESATILLEPRPPGDQDDCDPEVFARLVRRGFSQRRKQLAKLLGPLVADWAGAAAAIGVPVAARAEELAPSQWLALARLVAPPARPPQQEHAELLPVVDELDRPVGRATRHEVHRRGLRHRAVHIFVYNRTGELFLQKRSRHKDVFPGRWDSSAAGHVEAGRSYDETARRELEEELGIAAQPEPAAAVAAGPATGWEFVRVYRTTCDGPFRLSQSEIETGAFFPVAVVRAWVGRRPDDFATGFSGCFTALHPDPAGAAAGPAAI